MTGTPDERWGRAERRRAMRRAYENAAIWAVGNGLASSTLVVYLAQEYLPQEFAAIGLAVSLILAAPQLVGLLRLATPALLVRIGSRKRFCIASYATSGLLLAALPVLSAPGVAPSASASLAMLVVLWSAYHLLEYLGTVALWSWLGDIAPRRTRGRFIGVRERWLLFGRVAGALGGGGFVFLWRRGFDVFGVDTSALPLWAAYGVTAAVGAAAMIAAVVPLARMPDVPQGARTSQGPPMRELIAPFFDSRFLRLLAFGCWFSLCNGITQAAQGIYPRRVLELDFFWLLGLITLMRLVQSGIAPAVGRLADRVGNRPVMIGSQLLVASGPLFFLWASPERPWLLAGAYVVWIAYAGLNVCLPNLMLKLAPGYDRSSYIAAYFAVGGLFYASSTVAGGAILDWLRTFDTRFAVGPFSVDAYGLLFGLGAAARALGVLLLLGIVEPGAWSWRRILARRTD